MYAKCAIRERPLRARPARAIGGPREGRGDAEGSARRVRRRHGARGLPPAADAHVRVRRDRDVHVDRERSRAPSGSARGGRRQCDAAAFRNAATFGNATTFGDATTFGRAIRRAGARSGPGRRRGMDDDRAQCRAPERCGSTGGAGGSTVAGRSAERTCRTVRTAPVVQGQALVDTTAGLGCGSVREGRPRRSPR